MRGVGFSPDGTRLVVAGADNRARVYGLDGKMLEFFAHDGPVAGGGVPPRRQAHRHRRRRQDGQLWTPTLLWQASHAGPVRQAALHPKGDRVVSCGDDKTVKLWNAADGKPVKSIAAHDGPVIGVGVSADGTKIASIGADKALKVWTLAAAPGAKDEDKPVDDHAGRRRRRPWPSAPNGLRVAAAVTDATDTLLHVFDAASGKELLALREHTGAGAVAGLPRRQSHAASRPSADKTVRLSDVNVLAVLDAHAGGVTGVRLPPQRHPGRLRRRRQDGQAVGPDDRQGGARRSARCPTPSPPWPSARTARRSAPRPARRSRSGPSPTARKC